MDEGVPDVVGLPDGLDSMAGPELAAAFGELAPVLARLDPYDTPAASRAAAGLQAWARAMALRVHLVTAKAAAPPWWEQDGELSRSSAPYLAVSLGVSDRAASREIMFAWQVHERLPMLGEAMLAGRLTEGRARVLCDWTTGLPDDLARRACAQVLEWALDKPATRIRERITAVAAGLDPGYADRQYRAALAKCGVSAEQLPDGTGEVRAHHVPLDEAAATMGGLNALAKAAKADGDPRPIGRLRWLIVYGLADGHLRGLADEEILAHLAASRPTKEELAEAAAREEADRRTAQGAYDDALREERRRAPRGAAPTRTRRAALIRTVMTRMTGMPVRAREAAPGDRTGRALVVRARPGGVMLTQRHGIPPAPHGTAAG
jgi:hypothetical protein